MNPDSKFIPYGLHEIDEDDILEVTKVLRSNHLTSGPYTKKFEKAFAKYVDAKYAVVCSSGTAALHLASLSINLDQKSSVIVPSISFLATANAPHYTGAEIIFADVDPISGLVTPKTFVEAIKRSNNKIKAVYIVHLNGNSADMISISKIAQKHNIIIIEDACHALGTNIVNKKKVGSCEFSTISTFSFHPVKTIAMGEGGVVTTNDKKIYENILTLRNHGMEKNPKLLKKNELALDDNRDINPWFYQMRSVGYNYRTSEIHCALGLSQLKKIDKFYKKRKFIVNKYIEAFEKYYPTVKIVKEPEYSNSCFHLFVIHINYKKTRFTKSSLMRNLSNQGVGTQVHYIPIHKQPYWVRNQKEILLSGAEKYYESCLSLPLFPKMSLSDVEYVIDKLVSLLNKE